MPENVELFGLFIALVLGMGWGSFATMAIYRIPNNIPWIGKKPFCPKCEHELSFIDYISILSFFLRKGRCKYCNEKYAHNISYLITEIACSAIFVIAYINFGFNEQFILATGIGVATVMIAIIETEYNKVPQKIWISLLLLGVMYRTLEDGSIYPLFYSGLVMLVLALLVRHLCLLIKGKGKKGFDYLNYNNKEKFEGPGFIYVKIATICGAICGYSYILNYISVLIMLLAIWYILKPSWIKPSGIMVLLMLLHLLTKNAILIV